MGQWFWKLGLTRTGSLQFNSLRSWGTLLLSPWMWCGFAVYGIATVYWILLLNRFPLGIAYPLIVGFALFNALVVSALLLKEPLTIPQGIGVLLLIAAVFLLSGHSGVNS
jgi:multidrug transporter EmrE-like cation transporter